MTTKIRKHWRAVFTTDRKYACVKRVIVEVTGVDEAEAEAATRYLIRDMPAHGYSLHIEEVLRVPAESTE